MPQAHIKLTNQDENNYKEKTTKFTISTMHILNLEMQTHSHKPNSKQRNVF